MEVAHFGQSMSPCLRDGDIAIIDVFGPDTAYLPHQGDILLSRSGQEWVLHRVVRGPNGAALKGDRANYFDGEEVSESWGRLVGFRRASRIWYWGEDRLLFQRTLAGLSRNKRVQNFFLLRWLAFGMICLFGVLQRFFVLPSFRVHHLWKQVHPSREQAIHHLSYRTTLMEVDTLFAEKRIPIIVAKGLALAHRYYENSLMRSFSDLDLYVEPKNFKEAERSILEMGFSKFVESKWEGTAHKLIFHRREITIELHSAFSPTSPVRSHHFIASRKTKIPDCGYVRELSAEDHLLYLSTHAAQQHLFDDMQWLQDIFLLLRKEEDLDWRYIWKEAKRWQVRRSLALVFHILVRDYGVIDAKSVQKLPRKLLRKSPFIRLLLIYLSPRRLKFRMHRKPRFIYLMIKFLLRDSLIQAGMYGWSRFTQRGSA